MNNSNYQLYLKARTLFNKRKINEAIEILRKISSNEPSDNVIKFKLAKCLLHSKKTKQEGKLILLDLSNTQNSIFALFELGKLEASEGNNSMARQYFMRLLNTQKRNYAMLELGKLEVTEGNNSIARQYFEQLLNTQNRDYAMLELGRLEASEGNNFMARQYFKRLLNTQSNNYALLELGRLEVTEGNNSMARQYFEQLLNTQSENFALVEMIFLDIKEKNYLGAYKKISVFSNVSLFKKHYYDLKILLEYKLGKINQSEVLNKDYYISQLFNYDEDYALNHIKLHLDENNNKIKHTLFNSDIDLNYLFHYAREQINYLNPVEISIVHKYIVECGFDVSTINGISTKYIKVVTLPNTNNILTMYPISYYGKESRKTKELIK